MDCVSLTRRIVRRKSLFNQDNSVFSPVEDNDRRQGKTGLDWLLNLSPRLQRFATLATPYFQTADTHTAAQLTPSQFSMAQSISIPFWFWNLMPAMTFFCLFFPFSFFSPWILWIFFGFSSVVYGREGATTVLSRYISGPHSSSSSRRRLITLTFSSTHFSFLARYLNWRRRDEAASSDRIVRLWPAAFSRETLLLANFNSSSTYFRAAVAYRPHALLHVNV